MRVSAPHPSAPSFRCGSGAQRLSRRCITSRGQFNPIHDFGYAINNGIQAANEQEFAALISNPGPIRIGYSSDYLDWLYKSYVSKCKSKSVRHVTETKFQGDLLSSQLNAEGEIGAVGSGKQFMRPATSLRRQAAEKLRAEAQSTIDKCMIQQGLLDVFERQPQFPVIHINQADRIHIVELFKSLLLDKALEPSEVWDKALLYRAILSERRESYPHAFAYVFEAVDSTTFDSTAESDGTASIPSTFHKSPKESDYLYFLYLVKKYYIENAVQGHVVLRCHREPACHTHLLSAVPPAKSDEEVRSAIEKSNAEWFASATDPSAFLTPPSPSLYPPLQALWRCEENFPLLLLLVFGELNLVVSEDPFVKFPNALPFLTRPFSTSESTSSVNGQSSYNDRGGTNDISLAQLIGERRGGLMAPLRVLATSIDARGKDLRRLRQRFHREDILGHQTLLHGGEKGERTGNYTSFADWSYFNPRATRAEDRDLLQQKALQALREYEQAQEGIYRYSYDDAEFKRHHRPQEGRHTVPTYVPSLPHFLCLLNKDPHISFLMNICLSDGGEELSTAQRELDSLCYRLANSLYRTALEYHKEGLRRVNHQKVLVAAVLLDNFVESKWKAVLAEEDDGVAGIARRLGKYLPFEGRAIDAAGFTTDAKMDDYARWMAAPGGQK